MRVEGHRPNVEAQAAQRLDPAKPAQAGKSSRPVDPTEDHLRLSPDAEFVLTATRAVEKIPAIRQDLVERVRQKLADGQLSADPGRLADRIIDHLISGS